MFPHFIAHLGMCSNDGCHRCRGFPLAGGEAVNVRSTVARNSRPSAFPGSIARTASAHCSALSQSKWEIAFRLEGVLFDVDFARWPLWENISRRQDHCPWTSKGLQISFQHQQIVAAVSRLAARRFSPGHPHRLGIAIRVGQNPIIRVK